MPNSERFDYFYKGKGMSRFDFYKLPKKLFTDIRYMGLSAMAKLLYMLLLDRTSLSMENNWFDEYGRVYIYFTVEDAAGHLGVTAPTAVRLFATLDAKTGWGLIKKERQGQGKPTKIYVKDIMSEQEEAIHIIHTDAKCFDDEL